MLGNSVPFLLATHRLPVNDRTRISLTMNRPVDAGEQRTRDTAT